MKPRTWTQHDTWTRSLPCNKVLPDRQTYFMVRNVYQCYVVHAQWCAAKNVLMSAVSSAGASSAAK